LFLEFSTNLIFFFKINEFNHFNQILLSLYDVSSA